MDFEMELLRTVDSFAYHNILAARRVGFGKHAERTDGQKSDDKRNVKKAKAAAPLKGPVRPPMRKAKAPAPPVSTPKNKSPSGRTDNAKTSVTGKSPAAAETMAKAASSDEFLKKCSAVSEVTIHIGATRDKNGFFQNVGVALYTALTCSSSTIDTVDRSALITFDESAKHGRHFAGHELEPARLKSQTIDVYHKMGLTQSRRVPHYAFLVDLAMAGDFKERNTVTFGSEGVCNVSNQLATNAAQAMTKCLSMGGLSKEQAYSLSFGEKAAVWEGTISALCNRKAHTDYSRGLLSGKRA
jgi:hypothetical protein